MKRVRLLENIVSSEGCAYRCGEEADLLDGTADLWVAAGIAEHAVAGADRETATLHKTQAGKRGHKR